jgi:TRAP-type mannitol/chloroaromatic compound transport system permease small subunit
LKFLGNIGYIKLLLIHIGLGYAIFLFRPLSVVILHVLLFLFLLLIVNNKNRNNEALMAAAYISGAEVFFRMTHATIFWETGKYSVILFLIVGMIYKGSSSKSVTFWFYLLILFPGVVVASFTLDYDVVFRKAVAFNLAGPVCLGISAIYCYYKKVTKEQMNIILVMFLMPFITTMVYLYLYTPSIGEVLGSGTNSNVAASGGYGPNQISTVLGMGAFILVTRLFLIKRLIFNLIDLWLHFPEVEF